MKDLIRELAVKRVENGYILTLWASQCKTIVVADVDLPQVKICEELLTQLRLFLETAS